MMIIPSFTTIFQILYFKVLAARVYTVEMSAMLKYPDESDKPAAHHHHLRLQDDDQVSGAGDHVHDSNPIQQMFSDVMNGLPPAMSTAMFQHSIQSVKQLSTVLMDFFKHGLSYNQVNFF